jgi:glucosamine-phosphate N-acetyltransferase
MIREIKKSDLNDDFFTLLAQLSGKVSVYDPEEMWETYNADKNCITFVDEVIKSGEKTIIATSTVLMNHKFLHCGGIVGFIEDVVVLKNYRGTGTGKKIVEKCIEYAKEAGAYKVQLSCSSDNIPFYINCNLHVHEYTMRIDL